MEDDRLSILKKVEQGEISIEDAKEILGQMPEEDKPFIAKIEKKKELEDILPSKESYIPTRRERKLALAEKSQSLEPNVMITLEKDEAKCQWPWQDKKWKWMWQNLEHPIYVNHYIDLSEGTQLKILSYYGDLFIRGWDEPKLLINGAVFDLRIGQDENSVNIASSTGQLQIWIPSSVTDIEAKVSPGDMWVSKVAANAKLECQSGDLGCENVKGDVRVMMNGGDTRLIGIEGDIQVNSINGNAHIRNIRSNNVIIKADEGDISLDLNSVNSGQFRCENDKGDINLITGDEISCELLIEASKDGKIAPLIIPWNRLFERSQYKLHGIIKDGGASINIITQSGTVYIQESWIKQI